MKNNFLLNILFIAFTSIIALPLSAQGLLIHKNDGTVITVPHELLDSITIYKYNEWDSLLMYNHSIKKVQNIMKQYTGNGKHSDFGFPAIALFTDCSGQDMVSEDISYNWFAYALTFTDRGPKDHASNFIWSTYYQQIKEANNLIYEFQKITEKNPTINSTIKNYIGQALAFRAYDYLQLIQYYQFTYLGHENEPGLPIIDENTTEAMMKNNPRKTVKEVYDFIMTDLNKAINILANNKSHNFDTKSDISIAAAYGLRARANMLLGNYNNAAKDADMALSLSGAEPLSIQEVSVPGFSNIYNNNSWIWGIDITRIDEGVTTGIITWPSHLCSLTGNGYTTITGSPGVMKCINSTLYEKMDKSDVRRGWWINPQTHESPLTVNAWGITCRNIAQQHLGFMYPDYTNMKFGPDENQIFSSTNSQDWPLMRAEEMILIKAEALGRSQGVENGKAVLEGFLKRYRAPEYVCKATNLEEFIEEIFVQRRIELWGEGFSLQDILRFKKPIVRKNTNFSRDVTYDDLAAESAIFIYNIPEVETKVNKGIGKDQVNEIATPPSAIK